MSDEEKIPGQPARGIVYDLAERRGRARARTRTAQAETSRAGGRSEETPEARAKRVAELKAQIAAGTYHPDPEEVARKMLERGFPG